MLKGSLHVESPGGEDSISNMDESLDQEADAEVEGMQIKLEETEQQYRSGTEKPEDLDEDDDEDEEEDNEMEIDIQNKGKAETSENADSANKSGKHIQQTQHGLTEDSQKGHVIGQHENEAAEIQHNIQKVTILTY